MSDPSTRAFTLEQVRVRERYGPWAVVTGASDGIGRELAARLAEAGVHLVTQFPQTAVLVGVNSLTANEIEETGSEVDGVWDNVWRTARKSLILNGEMSEWLKEHAWKLTPLARADAYPIPPTHFRSTTSRDTDVRQHVPVNGDVAPGFRGVSDTVLTQNGCWFTATHIDEHRFVRRASHDGF